MNEKRDLIIAGAKNNLETYINSAWKAGFDEGMLKAQQQLASCMLPINVQDVLEAGEKGEEVRFYKHGRLFAIRELAQ